MTRYWRKHCACRSPSVRTADGAAPWGVSDIRLEGRDPAPVGHWRSVPMQIISLLRALGRVGEATSAGRAASLAGLVNTLNDGMSWGILLLFFATAGFGVERIGILKGVYPVVWGILRVMTG
jgi:hypothetical protein